MIRKCIYVLLVIGCYSIVLYTGINALDYELQQQEEKGKHHASIIHGGHYPAHPNHLGESNEHD